MLTDEGNASGEGGKHHEAWFDIARTAISKVDDPAYLTTFALYALAVPATWFSGSPEWSFGASTAASIVILIGRMIEIRESTRHQTAVVDAEYRARSLEALAQIEAIKAGKASIQVSGATVVQTPVLITRAETPIKD